MQVIASLIKKFCILQNKHKVPDVRPKKIERSKIIQNDLNIADTAQQRQKLLHYISKAVLFLWEKESVKNPTFLHLFLYRGWRFSLPFSIFVSAENDANL